MTTTNRPFLLIGLTGKNASGKTSAARFLKSLGFSAHSLSDALRIEAERLSLVPSRDNLIRLGQDLRRTEGSGFLASRLLPTLDQTQCVVDSVRHPLEVEILKAGAEHTYLWAIDAPAPLRYQRACARGRDESAATLEAFLETEARENTHDQHSQQIEACMKLADLHFDNRGSLSELEVQLRRAVQQLPQLTHMQLKD